MKLGHLFRLIFSIVVMGLSMNLSMGHALSGAAQGALLDLKNPAQSALWGAIGAAGAEVAMEAIYDPVARSKALIKEINQRVAQGELKEMLADVGVELPQPSKEIGGETNQRQGVVTRSQSRKQQEVGKTQLQTNKGGLAGSGVARPGGQGIKDFAAPSGLPRSRQQQEPGLNELGESALRNPVLSGTLTPAHHKQLMEGLTRVFTKELRADVERTRDLVRAGLSLGALASGVQSEQMSMMDGTASQALTHNAIPLVAYVGGAALEAALPGLLASAAGALGITYAWDALTDLFSGSTEQQLPFGNEDEKLRSKGKPSDKPVSEEKSGEKADIEEKKEGGKSGNKNLSKGKKQEPKGPQKDPEEDPKHPFPTPYFKRTNRNAKTQNDPNISKETKEISKKIENKERDLGPRDGKRKDQTTLKAGEIEQKGGKIDLAKQKDRDFNHVEKVQNAQDGMMENIDQMQRNLGNQKLPNSEHDVLKKIISRTSKMLDYTKKFVKPRTQAERAARSLKDRNIRKNQEFPSSKVLRNIDHKGE